MKDTFWFPIVFMLINVLIFTGILAVMYRFSEVKIQTYEEDIYQKKILGTMAAEIAEATEQSPGDIIAAYPGSFELYVRQLEPKDFEREVYQAVVDDEVVAYCFEIKGNGLWGSMRALISTSTDFKTDRKSTRLNSSHL